MMCPQCNYYGKRSRVGAKSVFWCNKSATIDGITYVGLNPQVDIEGDMHWAFANDCPAFDDSRYQARLKQWVDKVSRFVEAENALDRWEAES